MLALLTAMFASVSESTIYCRPSTVAIAQDNTLPNTTLKVLDWNVAKMNNGELWIRDYRQLVDELEPDIICLQEVRLNAQSQKIAALADIGWQFAPNFRNSYDDSYCGVLIGARADCVNNRALHSEYSEPIVNTPKVSIFSEFNIAGSENTLLVACVHAINFVSLRKFEAQIAAIAQILSQHRGSIILAGDFNTWSRKRLRSLLKTTEELGLSAVTFSATDQQYLKRFLRSPALDHLFYRGFSQVSGSARVIGTPSSDHNPLFAALSEHRYS